MPQAAYDADAMLPSLTLAQMLAYVARPGEYFGQTDAGAMVDLWDVKIGRVSLGDLGGGLKSFFKKVGKVLKKVAKVALPVLAIASGAGLLGSAKITALLGKTAVKAAALAGKIETVKSAVKSTIQATGIEPTAQQLNEAAQAVIDAAKASLSPGLPAAAVPVTAVVGTGAPITMETLKQYAPWIAGGIVLLVFLMKK